MLILVFVVSFGPKKGTLLTYDSFWRYPFYEYLKGVKTGVEHFISTMINNSLRSIKSYYWLYKYNLLHRSVFKNSHNLTIVKKLLTTGFYDTTVKTNNL